MAPATPYSLTKRIVRAVCVASDAVLLLTAAAASRAPPAAKLKARREAALRGLAKREWTIDGESREALVHILVESAPKPYPIVFAFHSHGGSMQNAATMFDYPHIWPEAIVV